MKFNLKWSLSDVDAVQSMLNRSWDARMIANHFNTTEREVIDLCARNGFRVPKSTLTPQGA